MKVILIDTDDSRTYDAGFLTVDTLIQLLNRLIPKQLVRLILHPSGTYTFFI